MTPRRFFDWRLVISVALLLLVSYAVWSGVEAAHRADDALSTLQDHDTAAAAARAKAERQRERAAREIETLQDKVDASLATQRDLLAYLQRHGLNPPARFVTVKRPRIVVVHRARRHAAHKPKPHKKTPHAAAPTGPGKSAQAPGHRKHKHGH